MQSPTMDNLYIPMNYLHILIDEWYLLLWYIFHGVASTMNKLSELVEHKCIAFYINSDIVGEKKNIIIN